MRHLRNHHGKDEEKRGQENFKPEMAGEIYEVVNDFDSATKERNDNKGNQNVLVVRKGDGDSFALLVERGKKKAEVKTFYKKTKTPLMFDAKSPNLNAQSDSVKSSIIPSIPQGQEKGKPESASQTANEGGQEAAGEVSNTDSNRTDKGGEVVVTGNEFGEYKDIKELRKKAIDYYRTNLQGTSVENAELGKIDIDDIGMVQFTTEGRQKVKANSAHEETLFLIKYLPELIANARDIEHKEANSEKHRKVGDSFYYLRTAYVRDGKKIPLEITLKKLHTGDIHYYNHIVEPKAYKNEAPVSPRTESPDGANVSKADGASSVSSVTQEQEKSKQESASQTANDTTGENTQKPLRIQG